MKKRLSKNESKVWEYLLEYLKDNGFMPTYARAGIDLDWSAQYVHSMVVNMEKKQWLKIKNGNIKL